jgi:response regulator RpfG family c-di-GMP phosphodiesterase
MRVLVVDDDALILQALTKILTNEGYEVVAHTDPIKAAEVRDFSVVITDYMMGGMTGIELLGHIKKNVPDAVRLMLTAAADFRVAAEAVNRGEVYRILSKPWSLAELQSVLRQAKDHVALREENRRLQQELEGRNALLEEMNKNLEKLVIERTGGLLEGMVGALDYRDTETQWHSRRVSLFSRKIAESVGIREPELTLIEQGALLHDIGKIGVRDSILLKPGPLTPEEWVEMKLHPEIGYRMLAKITYLKDPSHIVWQHQERWDGKGYPNGLKGQDIVVGARIFCIADTMDAITSDRPYRKGRDLAFAKSEIGRVGGTQLDPDLVAAYLAIPDSAWHDIRAHVEGQESTDKKLWEGKPLVNPVKDAFNKAVTAPPAPAPAPAPAPTEPPKS